MVERGFSAAVYTQTTDVEGEVNGLVTYDREVVKVDVDRLHEVNRRLVRSLDLRSFSAAAREMDVAVSVVARGVDRLEAGYGVRLLRRSTHGLSATPEGAELAQEARALLAQQDCWELVSFDQEAAAPQGVTRWLAQAAA